MTVIAFALALIAVPISGANCPAGCVSYPYLDTLGQFPRDFLWMGPAMLLVLGYTVLITALHAAAIGDARVYSQIALSIALITRHPVAIAAGPGHAVDLHRRIRVGAARVRGGFDAARPGAARPVRGAGDLDRLADPDRQRDIAGIAVWAPSRTEAAIGCGVMAPYQG